MQDCMCSGDFCLTRSYEHSWAGKTRCQVHHYFEQSHKLHRKVGKANSTKVNCTSIVCEPCSNVVSFWDARETGIETKTVRQYKCSQRLDFIITVLHFCFLFNVLHLHIVTLTGSLVGSSNLVQQSYTLRSVVCETSIRPCSLST